METFREELLHGRLVLYLAIRYRTSPEVSERPFRVHTQSEYFIQNHTPIEPPPRDKSYKLRRPTIILLSRNISMADRFLSQFQLTVAPLLEYYATHCSSGYPSKREIMKQADICNPRPWKYDSTGGKPWALSRVLMFHATCCPNVSVELYGNRVKETGHRKVAAN